MDIKLPTPEEIHEAYQAGEDAVQGVFASVSAQLEQLASHVQELHEVIQALRDQVQKHSRNSGTPPSSDGLKKPRTRSLRKSGQRPSGGQPGHPGQPLRQVEHPDHVRGHEVRMCQGCQGSLDGVEAERREKRQVFDIPALHSEVTEHQSMVNVCPHCGAVNIAKFPSEVSQPTQYGQNVKAHAAYLTNDQHLPLDRTAQLFEDVFGQQVSEGGLYAV